MPKSNIISIELSLEDLQYPIIFSAEHSNHPQLEALATKMMALIRLNSQAIALINDASVNGSIRVSFLPENPGRPGAWWDLHKNTVCICDNLDNPMKAKSFSKLFYSFLFEASNAANPFFQLGTPEAELVRISKHADHESYARMMEMAEYTTLERTSRIYAFAKAHKLWRTKDVGTIKGVIGFQDHWRGVNTVQKGMQLSHADYYREDFKETLARTKELEAQLEEQQRSIIELQSQINDQKEHLDSLRVSSEQASKRALTSLTMFNQSNHDNGRNMHDEIDPDYQPQCAASSSSS